MTPTEALMDFTIASILILIGQLARAKIKPIQEFFVPASLIAGMLGLICGKHFLNILPFSQAAGSYAGMLIIVIFAAVGMNGFSFGTGGAKEEVRRVTGFYSYRLFAHCAQIALPVLFSVLLIAKVAPYINDAFGFCLIAGFSGGHGTAAAVGSTFAKLGFEVGQDLCMTSATVGIFSGVIGGMILVKIGAMRGYTQFIKDFRYISGDLRTGMIAEGNQKSVGKDGVSVVSIDPIAWHLALLLVPSGLGIVLTKYLANSFSIDVPNFTSAFVVAIAFWAMLSKAGVYKHVDVDLFNRISGCATDYLVFFGVAMINIPVVIEYALPLALLMVFGILLVLFTFWIMGPAMNKECWFERCLFCYGYLTGVFAIGFVLLRIVDPENRSKTLNDIALTTPFTTPVEVLGWTIVPPMLMAGLAWNVVGLFGAICIGCVIFSLAFKLWYYKMPLDTHGKFDET